MSDELRKNQNSGFSIDHSPAAVGEFILYTTEDGQSRVECRFENETIWLSQALMAELFETTPQNITLHLKAIYEDEEIDEKATCKDYLQVRQESSIQNKLYFAATGQTAAELVVSRADSSLPNMGLTVWKGEN